MRSSPTLGMTSFFLSVNPKYTFRMRLSWRDDINAAQDEIKRLEELEPDPDLEPEAGE